MQRINSILTQLNTLYDRAVGTLRADILSYARGGTLPAPGKRTDGSYAYPELVIRYAGEPPASSRGRAYGRLNAPGTYATTVTRPQHFAAYLAEQLEIIAEDYRVEVEVRPSRQEIPFPYVLDGEAGAELAGIEPQVLARHFPATELALIGDELADGIDGAGFDGVMPLSLFDGLRTDFSLARLAHYTGTSIEHFQRYVLFTNYHRYVDEFVDWAAEQLGTGGHTALAGAGGLMITEPRQNARLELSDTAWRRHQMPAYHLVGARPQRDHAGQHRGGPFERQDDHRPSRGLAARGVADDRPLRRPSPHAEDRRLRARARVPARRPRARSGAAARDSPARDRRSPAGALRRGGGSFGRRRAPTSSSACAPGPWSPPTIATGSCATPVRPAG